MTMEAMVEAVTATAKVVIITAAVPATAMELMNMQKRALLLLFPLLICLVVRLLRPNVSQPRRRSRSRRRRRRKSQRMKGWEAKRIFNRRCLNQTQQTLVFPHPRLLALVLMLQML
jgi:hypothetical protein